MRKMLLFSLLLCLLAACGGTGESATPQVLVSPPETAPEPTEPEPTPEPTATLPPDALARLAADYPAVDGSTSARPLQKHILCHVLDLPCRWYEVGEEPIMHGFETNIRHYGPEMETLEERLDDFNQVMATWHTGTHGAYERLIRREVDMILVARQPSEDELSLAKANNVILDLRPVALDAFVFLAHTDNPLESISLDEIRQIYTGELTDWTELGVQAWVEETAISPYQRNLNSGSQELMNRLVMSDLEMIDAPEMIMESMMGPINAISSDPLGIGYSVFFYAQFMFPLPEVRLVAVEGVLPTSETIADGSYPLAAEVYVVVRQDVFKDSLAYLLRDWLLTPEGQEVVAGSGYVPIVSP